LIAVTQQNNIFRCFGKPWVIWSNIRRNPLRTSSMSSERKRKALESRPTPVQAARRMHLPRYLLVCHVSRIRGKPSLYSLCTPDTFHGQRSGLQFISMIISCPQPSYIGSTPPWPAMASSSSAGCLRPRQSQDSPQHRTAAAEDGARRTISDVSGWVNTSYMPNPFLPQVSSNSFLDMFLHSPCTQTQAVLTITDR
jgi:hypothetical protein